METKGMKRLWKRISVTVTAIAVAAGTMVTNVGEAKAEEIIHTHIWATKYDQTKHWEYCTVCDKTRNVKEHECIDHWFQGSENCYHKNYSTRICECGYNYKYTKPHSNISNWNKCASRIIHFKYCIDCGTWTTSERCKDAQGLISCKNPGTCLTCGETFTKDNHYIVKDGKCRDCEVKMISIDTPSIQYESDYSKATVKFTIKPELSSVTVKKYMNCYTGTTNYTNVKWSYVENSDRSVTYTGVYTFDANQQRKCLVYIAGVRDIIFANNVSNYLCTALSNFTIWQDHTKPALTEIKQVDQKMCNDWATIKELTIEGTENLSKIVTISIIDPETGDIIVDQAKTTVTNGKYTYKCTPPLEGPAEGRKYVLKVTDEIGNTMEKDFMIYKTDCRAPLLRSEKEYTEWSQTKNLELKLTDYGSGSAQTSLINQTSYKSTTLVDGNYIAKYTFAEENYGVTEYKLYVRDGLGNAGLETIKVGRVDNTKPTVTGIQDEKIYVETETPAEGTDGGEMPEGDETNIGTALTTEAVGVKLTVEANDMNTELNAEGSKVAGYAITKTQEEPTEDMWQGSNVIEINEAGKYYLWVKDGAGNMADVQVIKVNDDFSVEYNPEDSIVVDPEEPAMPGEDEEETEKEDKNNNKDSNKDGEKDNTPKTGDTSYIALAAGLMFISGIIILGVTRKRARNI